MRWDEDHESSDLIDRRGDGPAANLGGLMWLLPMLLRTPLGWVILAGILVFSLFKGVTRFSSGNVDANGSPTAASAKDPEARFVGFVLDDVQSAWASIFAQSGENYQRAKLVLYTQGTNTGCGYGEAAAGPFYCPGDERVYIDLSFYHELSQRLGARGQFAQAYVIAHEIGHHIQKLTGTSSRAGVRDDGASGGSVRLELQADCYAGIWAYSTAQRKLLESGDIESAIGAAAAVGDDRLQQRSRGVVSPESFTHGSSEQRMRWFKVGYEQGSVKACDTFKARSL